MRALLVALVALLALAGCGRTTEVREPSIEVAAQGTTSVPRPEPNGAVRIAVVTHGQASSPFWAIVRNGVEAAAREADVVVDYRAPDIYNIDRMVALVDQAIASRPDGLVVSFPEPALAPAIRQAVAAGIPTVTINSGATEALRLGVLAHVGQPERLAGRRAGKRLVALGVRRALCVSHQAGNQGLRDRCAGLDEALRAAGGRTFRVLIDDLSDTAPDVILRAVRRDRADGVLTLNSTGGLEAEKALRRGRLERRVALGTFDLGPDVLADVRAGRIAFAVDQQAYLQGYLPVLLLAQRARFGLFPQQGGVIQTGPNFVTRANAAQAIELSRRSIR